MSQKSSPSVPPGKLSQRKIAEALGVSQATVSLVLNDARTLRVSPEVRRSILDYCEKAGYRLESRRFENSIAVCFDLKRERAKPIHARILNGVQAEALRRGKLTTLEAFEHNESFFQRLARVDGALVAERASKEELERLGAICPVVTVNNHVDGQHCDAVVSDNRGGVRMVVRRLHELGHRRVAFVGLPPLENEAPSPRWIERSSGYRESCFDLGLDPAPDFLLRLQPDKDWEVSIQEALRQWKSAGRMPTAIVLESDWIAISLYRCLAAAKLRVPQDVSVVGFGDFDICEAMAPTLSSVHQHFEEMGRVALEMLAQNIEQREPRPPRRIVCNVDIVERGSIGPAPKGNGTRS